MFDYTITRKSRLKKLVARSDRVLKNETAAHDIAFLKAMPPEARSTCIDLLDRSKAQLRQDLFCLVELGFRREGFFVEFGATNGLELSNTHLLEKEFGWTGILAEPARVWHDALRRNRSAAIETKCVWKASGATLSFNETERPELSTIDAFTDSDKRAKSRIDHAKYDVETISLNDLLAKHEAPHRIDFLSVDTEGSELDILQAFDFDAHDVRIITCEHNKDMARRAEIFDLLSRNGYQRKFEDISQVDDWYVRTAT